MNEEQNVNTSPKPKKKRSFWWLKLLLILILFAAGLIAGMMLTSQPVMSELRDEILDEFDHTGHAVKEPVITPVLTPAPTDKPVEYKVSPTPAPKASKAPVEIISPEEQEKAENKENEATPETTTVPAVAATSEPFEAAGPIPTAEPEYGPAAGLETVSIGPAAKEYIGIDAALEAALKHAGVNKEDAIVYSVSRERDDGMVYYDVEFAHNGKEYEYEINALTASVEGWKTVREKNSAAAASSDSAVSAGTAQTSYVSIDDAKNTALFHAGYEEHEVTDLKAGLEIDRNKVVYDIEFWAEGYDYDYKVDAESGLVIMVEKERD